MILFDNLSEKLAQIRKDEFYSPYIEVLKRKYLKYSQEEISVLTYKDFMYFYESGSRAEYESKYFARRDRLNCAYILYLIYGEDEYLTEVCNCIWTICTEISWALPAHLDVCPIAEHRTHIDLFAAETAFGLAEIYYMIGDKLPERIRELIIHELEERTFSAYEKITYCWETVKSNWAAVCAGSVGMAYMCAAPERFDKVKDRILKTIDSYLSGFGDDGCCQEGISYWDYGFSFYIMFADMLAHFTKGDHDIRHSQKVDRIALCNQRLVLRNDATVSFSDGARKAKFSNIGLYSYLKKHYPGVVVPQKISIPKNFGKASSTALRMFLWSNPEDYTQGEHADLGMRYFEDAKWYINKREKYSFAAKAGHNMEEHNHNDVGSFIVATDEGQVLADIGAMEYTRQNFRNETRYTIIQNSSLGHSLPIIDGKGQGFGEKYCGQVKEVGENSFSLEMQDAYDGDIKKIERCFTLEDNCITVRDSFEYTGNHSITERFISFTEPEYVQGKIKLGNVFICTDAEPEISKQDIKNHTLEMERVYFIDYPVKGQEFLLKIEVL